MFFNLGGGGGVKVSQAKPRGHDESASSHNSCLARDLTCRLGVLTASTSGVTGR